MECDKHVVGTTILGLGKIFLGMPKGFDRLGQCDNTKIYIFETLKDGWVYDKFNIPVWKYKDELGHIIVRGISPRINTPFIHVFLEDCLSKIDCIEITSTDIREMD